MRLFSMYGWVRRRHQLGLRGRSLLEAPWTAGAVLLLCVMVAMLLANLPATAEYYRHLLETDLSLRISSPDGAIDWVFPRGMTVEKFINDGLMVIFFFSVGLEIKREIVCGQLSSFRRAILPVLAALGGMIAPALVFLTFNAGTPTADGWGIPTATDIAFAIGILSLMGDRVPVSLKIFLTALAIADDLGAIVVIALFYGGTVEWSFLILAVAIMIAIYIMKVMGETRAMYYLVPAVVVWGLFYYSGVHSTISGVAMAMLIPMKPRYSRVYFERKAEALARTFRRDKHAFGAISDEREREYQQYLWRLSRNSLGLSYRLEERLYPYVNFLIIPIFALANAGVTIGSPDYFRIFTHSPEAGWLGAGIFFGLLVGKPLGIFLTSWVAVRTKLAEMPSGASWRMLFAVACLGGIGFTMSIFVDSLAFAVPEVVDRGKIAILSGSAAAAMLGILLIMLFSRKQTQKLPVR